MIVSLGLETAKKELNRVAVWFNTRLLNRQANSG